MSSSRSLRRRALSLALLLSLAAPAAFAADPACRDASGNIISPAPSTDQGIEGGVENATCNPYSLAFGAWNNANNGGYAFGGFNRALGADSAAFGTGNFAYGVWGSAFGVFNRAYGDYSVAFGTAAVTQGVGRVALGGW